MKSTLVSLLVVLSMTSALDVGNVLDKIFNRNTQQNSTQPNVTTIDEYGPIIVKTMLALKHASIPQQTTLPNATMLIIPYSELSRIILERDGTHTLLITIQDNSQQQQNNQTSPIPFLMDLLPNANASTSIISTYQNQIAVPLSRAVEQLMGGEEIFWTTFTGQHPSSSALAIMGAVAHALKYPTSSINVITFGQSPWQQAGFNAQFSYVFDRFISLYYFWPFTVQNFSATSALSSPSVFAENASLEPSLQYLGQECMHGLYSFFLSFTETYSI